MRLRTALLGATITVLTTTWSAIAQTVVSIPPVIEALTPTSDQSSPDIKILSPQPGTTVNSTEVMLQLSARRFTPSKDPATGLGLHFKVIVDNNSPIDYFDPSKPLKLNLSPGTHTIRVVATRPWNQSYRNRGSQAYVTFNVQQSDGKNVADYNQPVGLLTVVSPASGTYGAEPILLDYLVDGVNLGRTASVRYTLNGRSVKTTDRFPLYLTGLQPGQNSLVVELLGASGQVRPNAGLNRVDRTIFYQPGGQDSLSKLIRGELKPKDLKDAVGPNPFVFDAQGVPKPLK
jgi:hypothetical protein